MLTMSLARLLRVASLAIEDLLEHLAHARPHQGVLLGGRVVIATPDPGQLARIKVGDGVVVRLIRDIVAVVAHGGIVARRNGCVNGHEGFLATGTER
jgi:hypothetical protein